MISVYLLRDMIVKKWAEDMQKRNFSLLSEDEILNPILKLRIKKFLLVDIYPSGKVQVDVQRREDMLTGCIARRRPH